MWPFAVVALALLLPQTSASKPDDVTLMKANLGGSCSADFTVKYAFQWGGIAAWSFPFW